MIVQQNVLSVKPERKKMKIYFRHHSGWEFSFQYQPLEKDKFYILAALASFAMLLATMLLWEFWR